MSDATFVDGNATFEHFFFTLHRMFSPSVHAGAYQDASRKNKQKQRQLILCALKTACLTKVNRVIVLADALEVINAINGEEDRKILSIILDIYRIIKTF